MSQSLIQTKSSLNLAIDVSVLAGAQPIPADPKYDAPAFARQLERLLHSCADGALSFTIVESQGAVKASATATLLSVVSGNSVTIGGVTFTGSNTPSTAVQFLTGTTDTASAASLAALINAQTVTKHLVYATSALGVVTITCLVPGPVGNFVTLTAVGSPITVTGSGFLAGGSVTATYTSSDGF